MPTTHLKKTILVTAVTLSTALTLAACNSSSSSSSGGGNGGSPGNNEAQHDDAGVFSTSAPLNSTNDVETATAKFNDGVTGDQSIDQFIGDVERAFSRELTAQAANSEDSHQSRADRIRARFGKGRANGEAEAASFTEACPGGGEVTADQGGDDWDARSGSAWDELTFTNCQLNLRGWGHLTLNGTYSEERDWDDATPGFEDWTAAYEIQGTVSSDNADDPLILSGSESWRWSWDDSSETLDITIPRLEFVVGDHYIGFLNVDLAWSEEEQSTASGSLYPYEERWTGQFGSSALGGNVDISTPQTIAGPNFDACPTQGVFRLSGDDGVAEARFGADSGTSDEVVLEINGSAAERFARCDDFYDRFELLGDAWFD